MRAALVALLILAVPLARAQDVTLTLQGPSGLQPPLQDIPLPATLSVPCRVLANGTGSVAFSLQGAPEWLSLGGNASPLSVGPCGADPQVAHATLTLRIAGDAPAYAQVSARVVATVLNQTAGAPVSLAVDARALVQATSDADHQEGGPQTVLSFPVHVENVGNVLTRVTFGLGPLPAGWSARPPTSLTLPTRADAARSGLASNATVTLYVQTPHHFGSLDDTTTILVLVNATALGGSAASTPAVTNLTLSARVKGFDAPGPSVPWAALALVAAAGWARRRAR